MTESATYRTEKRLSLSRGRSGVAARRGRQEAHEENKVDEVAGSCGQPEPSCAVGIDMIFGRCVETTTARGVPLVRKDVVGDTLLDVVGFPREYGKGFILSFPPEPSHASIIFVAIGMT